MNSIQLSFHLSDQIVMSNKEKTFTSLSLMLLFYSLEKSIIENKIP